MLTLPRDAVGLVRYAFLAFGNQTVTFRRLWFFLSFDLRQFTPSKARKIIEQLLEEGVLTDREGVLLLSPEHMDSNPSYQLPEAPSSVQQLGTLLREFVGESRLSRAVALKDTDFIAHVVATNPLRVEAEIEGTQKYRLVIDEQLKLIQHDCPDWARVLLLRRFCKHIAKLFLVLEKEVAFRILRSLQSDSWQFEKF